MTIDVIAWPPVESAGSEWTEIAPVQTSRSLITGADYTSAAQRKRRVVSLRVSAWDRRGNMGAGYVENLKLRLGGIHAVRLYSRPINYHKDAAEDRARYENLPLTWTSGGDGLTWTMPPEALVWYSGIPLTGVIGTSGGWNIVTVSGLPPNSLVARPAEFVKVQEDAADATGSTARVVTEAYSDASGVAVIRLFTALAYDGIITLRTSDTGVFKPDMPYPRAIQAPGQNWYYDWSFREVFADEVGGFVEVDPWS